MGICRVICVGVVMLPQHLREILKDTWRKPEKTHNQNSQMVWTLFSTFPLKPWKEQFLYWSTFFLVFNSDLMSFRITERTISTFPLKHAFQASLLDFKETFCWLSCSSAANYPNMGKLKWCNFLGLVKHASVAKEKNSHSMQCFTSCPHAIRHRSRWTGASLLQEHTQMWLRVHARTQTASCEEKNGSCLVITALSLSAQTICRPRSP